MITKDLQTLEINKLAEYQYKRLREEGSLKEDSFYITPDDEDYATEKYVDDKIGEIESVLAEIIELQESLIGGDSV